VGSSSRMYWRKSERTILRSELLMVIFFIGTFPCFGIQHARGLKGKRPPGRISPMRVLRRLHLERRAQSFSRLPSWVPVDAPAIFLHLFQHGLRPPAGFGKDDSVNALGVGVDDLYAFAVFSSERGAAGAFEARKAAQLTRISVTSFSRRSCA
jgi:hypothetical protein